MALSWVGFNDETLPQILKQLNIKEDNGHLADITTSKEIVCECCQELITKGNLGNIVPGSKKFYCKELNCFASYIQTTIE